jgi:Domain of unknown function (DUF222)
MPDPTPGPGPDGEQPASASGRPYLDWQALLDALAAGGLLDGDPGGQDAAAEQAAAGATRMSAPLSPGRAGALGVEHMAPGPVQAGWLAAAAGEVRGLDEYELAGVAIAARRLASWAQAAELSAVARITARAAAADRRIGLAGDGRPGRVCRDAVGQVSLALMLTDHAAAGWADLAVTLAWRLPETGQALAAGTVDLPRAKAIAEATAVLGEDTARAVEAMVLPGAGGQTTAQLRARLRRAVIADDPDAAERRREEAERQARVSLYPDQDGTATLAGAGLPAIEAAAAMARITAIARAMKAAGQGGGLDLHRARVMLGLLLGTLPYIPRPAAPPNPSRPAAATARPAAGTIPSGRAAARTATTMTMTMTGPEAGRCRRGRTWARSRPRWPAPAPPTGAPRPGCWISPCPGPPWPGTAPRPACWAASAPSPPPRPAIWPAPPPPTPPPSGASSSPATPGKPSPSPASPAAAPATRRDRPATARRPAPTWPGASP